ncbi:hypothetical protein [Kitasatospora griseola]|uniref:hypothetical protein n=1 Tax=Kitasatospora griseola TaxID=2064 RepID=UPI0034250F0D
MALSRVAAEFAAEIKQQYWRDAHRRADSAGHQPDRDSARRVPEENLLTEGEAETVKTNVASVTAQVLAYNDPDFDVV